MSAIKIGAYYLTKNNPRELLRLLAEKQDKIDKAIDKLQLLIDIGFDYDGFNQVESLKTLIDELVEYAKESIVILKEVE